MPSAVYIIERVYSFSLKKTVTPGGRRNQKKTCFIACVCEIWKCLVLVTLSGGAKKKRLRLTGIIS